MSELTTRSFALFSRDRLKDAVEAVTRRRHRSLFVAIGVAAGVFVVLAAGVWLFFSPYRDMLGRHDITYWPLMFVAPASLALIVFCLVYILGLRSAVKEFRETLVSRIAEFIDPSIVHETGPALPREELENELLATMGGTPLTGTDRFRGNVAGTAARFTDLRLKRERTLSGLYFHATMEKQFAMPLMVFPSSVEVSRGGLESKLRSVGENIGTGLLRLDDPALGRQILVPSGGEEFVLNLLSAPAYAKLEALRKANESTLALSCRGEHLRIALLAPAAKQDAQGLFDEFDFAQCRKFCEAARLCLDLTRGMAERGDLWKA